MSFFSNLSFSLLLLFFLLFSASSRFDRHKKVGIWAEIPDAKSDNEIRDLGIYSVDEYNHRHAGVEGNSLAFSGVVSAGRQVVSGVKYRIRISAVDRIAGDARLFDAVVVVRPWMRHRDRDLVSFGPSDD